MEGGSRRETLTNMLSTFDCTDLLQGDKTHPDNMSLLPCHYKSYGRRITTEGSQWKRVGEYVKQLLCLLPLGDFVENTLAPG